MLSKRALLKSLIAANLIAGAAATRAASLRGALFEAGDAPLRVCAHSRGVVYGAAANSYQLGDSAFAAALAREAGMLVPEYEMKRGVIEAVRGRFDFAGVDKLMAFARAHAMAFRGHPLVWHKRNPDWLDDALLSSRDSRLLTSYIATVAGRYRGRMHSVDVVNEAIAPGDGRADDLRDTVWLKAYGPGYIDEAFYAARAADPDTLLVYNDWGCEAGEADNDRFRAATLNFLERALSRRVPIDGLGLQGHLAAFGPQVDQGKLRTFLERVKSLGLRILVTEHDVDDSGGPSDTGERDRAVADASRRFLDVMLGCDATIAVLTWGLSDRFLKAEGWRDRLWRGTPRELPLDPDLRHTAMWHAMAEAFARA
ncbi:MAG: endo-1,4-beta-xylanase [Rhizomicrobium sp.]